MRFMKNYSKVVHYALTYAMNDEFLRILHEHVEFLPSNRVKGEVIEVSNF